MNIISTMFYVFEKKNWRWCRYNTVRCHISGITVSDGVTPSPKGGESARPPLNPPLIVYLPVQPCYDRLNTVELTYLITYLQSENFTWIFKYNFRPFAAPSKCGRYPPHCPRYATDDNVSRSTTEIREGLHGVPCLLPLLLPFPTSPFPFPCHFSLIQVRDLGERCKLP